MILIYDLAGALIAILIYAILKAAGVKKMPAPYEWLWVGILLFAVSLPTVGIVLFFARLLGFWHGTH